MYLVPDHKSFDQSLRPDLPAGQSAEHAGIFEQAVKRERAAQQNKDGSQDGAKVGKKLALRSTSADIV